MTALDSQGQQVATGPSKKTPSNPGPEPKLSEYRASDSEFQCPGAIPPLPVAAAHEQGLPVGPGPM